jgi:hypothetical protein
MAPFFWPGECPHAPLATEVGATAWDQANWIGSKTATKRPETQKRQITPAGQSTNREVP